MKDHLKKLVDETNDERLLKLKAALKKANVRIAELKEHKADLARELWAAAEACIGSIDIPPVPAPVIPAQSGREETAVLMLGDWQLGKVTPNFNTDILRKRINGVLADKVVSITDIQRMDHPVDNLHIWLLGDIVEGELIFPGQAHEIDASLYRQVMELTPELLANLIRRLLGNFEKIHICGVVGNHGRMAGRSSREIHPETNADLFAYKATHLLLRDEPRVTWDVPLFSPELKERAWWCVDNIGDYSCLLFHGDQIRNYNVMPWYGFQKKIGSWYMLAHDDRFPLEPFKEAACGHFHQETKLTLNAVKVRVNGTPESYNCYALEGLASMGEPSQTLFYVSPEKGRVTAEYPLDLTLPGENISSPRPNGERFIQEPKG
jgi:hypothetical protein